MGINSSSEPLINLLVPANFDAPDPSRYTVIDISAAPQKSHEPP